MCASLEAKTERLEHKVFIIQVILFFISLQIMRYCNNNNNNNSNNNNKNNNTNLNGESRGHIFSNKYCLYWLSNNKNNRQILIRD